MKIGGKERPIKVGINQSQLYCSLRGISITRMNEELATLGKKVEDISIIRDLLWSALKDGARYKGLEFDHDHFTVGDWLEEMDPKDMEGFYVDLVGSMPEATGKPIDKKKAVGS